MVKSRHGLASDRQGKLVERDRQAPGHRLLDRELVMASSQILHEAMPGDHDPGAAVLLEPAHRTQPRLQPAVVTLDVVVGIPIGAMPDRRQQLLEHRQVHRRMVVTTSTGVILVVPMARSKKRRAALP
jgi:hypothetical protein